MATNTADKYILLRAYRNTIEKWAKDMNRQLQLQKRKYRWLLNIRKNALKQKQTQSKNTHLKQEKCKLKLQ